MKILPKIFFVLTLLSGFLVLWPFHDFIVMFSQGDRGRDFYVFQRTMLGDIPYRDYFWNYGPLPPYFYALFLKMFGVSIPSVLIGEIFVKILCGLVIYLSLALFFELPLAFLGAVWFWIHNPDFFHTGNHLLGILGILTALHFVFKYIITSDKKWTYGILGSVLLVFLSKYNMGLAALAASCVALVMIDTALRRSSFVEKIRLLFPFVLLFAGVFGGYALLLRGLPEYYLRQCFPLPLPGALKTFPLEGTASAFFYMARLFEVMIRESFVDPEWTLMRAFRQAGFLAVVMAIAWRYWSGPLKAPEIPRKKMILVFASMSVFLALGLHEFLLSGVFYKIFWITPVYILFCFMFIGLALRSMARPVKAVFFLCLCVSLCFGIERKYVIREKTGKFSDFFFMKEKNAKVFVNNPPEWVRTVEEVSRYLEGHLAPGEMFLALPYEPLYYYLTDRKSPVPENTFFGEFITTEQERRIITDLERKKINTIILSNRCLSKAEGLGVFGIDYCPLLAKYLFSNFKKEAGFGNWQEHRDLAINHAVMIYKRK